MKHIKVNKYLLYENERGLESAMPKRAILK